MLILNRNKYEIEEYGYIGTKKVTADQFYILEILQGGNLCNYYDIARWVQKRRIQNTENGKQISQEALNIAISRLRRKGFDIKCREIFIQKYGKIRAYQLETEIWEK